MTLRTMVAIFIQSDPEDDPFGVRDQLGTGSLIARDAVLVHPPFSLELAVGHRPKNLHVCATTWNTDPPQADVIAVRAVEVGCQDRDSQDPTLQSDPGTRHQPVVVLRLCRATDILQDPPVHNLQAVLRLLADPFNGPGTDVDDPGTDVAFTSRRHRPHWLCRNLHICCS